MGLFSKKTKTTSSQNTTATSTPTNPLWVQQGVQDLNSKIGQTFGGIDPNTYVAGPNPLQTQAGAGAGALTTNPAYGTAQGFFSDAAGGAPQHVGAASSLDGLDKYMNPFLKDVVDTSLKDFDFGAGMTRAQNKLALAGDETFGGSSGAIQTTLSNDALNRGRGTLSAGLRSDGFNTALAASADDANRRQQAEIANAGFGESALNRKITAGDSMVGGATAQGASDRANIDTQNTVGGGLRDIQNQKNQAPVNLLMQQIASMTGLPLDLFKGMDSTGTMNGTTTSKTSGASLTDWMNFFAQNASSAAKASGGGG